MPQAADQRAGRGLRAGLLACAAAFVLAAGGAPSAQAGTIVAAASDLTFALEGIAAQFAQDTGQRVQLVFGSSGNLTRQLLEGAPYELFLSADEESVRTLTRAGVTRDDGVLYAVGRLAIFAPHGSPLRVDARLEGLRELTARPGFTRLAIANPAHAPYGRAAEAALRATGLWNAVAPSLVLGDSVAQAAHFATTGNAVGGLIAHSFAAAAPLSRQGTYAAVSETLHPPIRQRMALTRRGGSTAERFYTYLQGSRARAMLQEFGFSLPQ